MAYGMENIANMLARSGATTGAQIGQAPRKLGEGIGGMLSGIPDKIKEAREEEEVRALLQKHKDNPEALRRLEQEYALKKKVGMASLFKSARVAAETASKAAETDSKNAASQQIEGLITQISNPSAKLEDISSLSSEAYAIANEFDIDVGKVRNAIYTANTRRQDAIRTSGAAEVDATLVQMLQTDDPDEMDRLERQAIATSQSTGNNAREYVGMASKVRKQRDAARLAAANAEREAREAKEAEIINNTATLIMSENLTDVPLNITDGELRQKIQDEVVDRRESQDEFKNYADGNSLPPEYIKSLEMYQKLFPDRLSTTEMNLAIKTINDTEGKGPSKLRRNAIDLVKKAVDSLEKDAVKARANDTALGMDVDEMIEVIQQSPDYTYFGNTMQDFLVNADEDLVKKFRKNSINVLKQHPDALRNPEKGIQFVVDEAMAGMKSLITDEQLNRDRAAYNAQENEARDGVLNSIARDNNLDREDPAQETIVQRIYRERFGPKNPALEGTLRGNTRRMGGN